MPIIDIFIDTVSDPKEITDALNDLVDNACIVYLKRSNNYLKLKESSGVDIQEQIKNRIEKLRLTTSTKSILNELAFDNYLYPVKYNDKNCITRYFEFKFTDSVELLNGKAMLNDFDATGVVQAVFFNSYEEFTSFTAEDLVKKEERTIFVVPNKYVDISSFVFEYKAVGELKAECDDDDILSDEYDVYLEDLDIIVNNFIHGYTRPEQQRVNYYYNGIQIPIYRKAQLSSLLSDMCEQTYPHTPIINNESINKNVLPTVAINSRTKLTTAILENDIIDENLGLTGTGQDVSFMRSTLIQTGILVENNGVQALSLSPKDKNIANILLIMSYLP